MQWSFLVTLFFLLLSVLKRFSLGYLQPREAGHSLDQITHWRVNDTAHYVSTSVPNMPGEQVSEGKLSGIGYWSLSLLYHIFSVWQTDNVLLSVLFYFNYFFKVREIKVYLRNTVWFLGYGFRFWALIHNIFSPVFTPFIAFRLLLAATITADVFLPWHCVYLQQTAQNSAFTL